MNLDSGLEFDGEDVSCDLYLYLIQIYMIYITEMVGLKI